MQYTVSYTTTPDHDFLAKVVVEIPWNNTKRIPENSVKAKFDEIFRACFGNTLDYRVTEIEVGSHYETPVRIK